MKSQKLTKGIVALFFTVLFCISLLSTPLFAQNNRITLLHGQKIFVSGINVAWHRFSDDVGSRLIDEAWFTTMLDSVNHCGGNAIRWWLFTNAANAPTFDANGYVNGPGSATIVNIRKVLDMAKQRGVVICLCLLSFDLFQTSQQGVNAAFNRTMMTTDAGIQAFIDKALIPLVKAVGYHPAIMCWEVFNEPEGMCSDVEWAGWTSETISINNVQAFINKTAAAIHREVPGIPVSNGSWCLKVSSNAITQPDNPGFNRHYYSDSALIAAGGEEDGALDFDQSHYYDWAEEEFSPFHHEASFWKLKKPLVIGEFSAKGAIGFTPGECYNLLYDKGYAGGMSWTYTGHDGHGSLADASLGTRDLYEKYPADIIIDFPPAAENDYYGTAINTLLSVSMPGVLTNDTDYPDSVPVVDKVVVEPVAGTVSLLPDGSFTYTPKQNFRGIDMFSYAVKDTKSQKATARASVRVYNPAFEHYWALPDASGWIFRSSWQDQNQGSGVLNDREGNLVVNHKAFRSYDTWIIDTANVITCTANSSYYTEIDFRDDPASPVDTLCAALVKAWDDYGPTDTTYPNACFGYSFPSLYFSTLRDTIKVLQAGAYHLAFKLAWDSGDGNGPVTDYYSFLRKIYLSPLDSAVTPLQKPFIQQPVNRVLHNLWYDKKGTVSLSFHSPVHTAVEVAIYSLSGKRVAIRNTGPCKATMMRLSDIRLVEGAYIVRLKIGKEQLYRKIFSLQ